MVTNNTTYDLYKLSITKETDLLLEDIDRLNKHLASLISYFDNNKRTRPKSVNDELLYTGNHPLLPGDTREEKYFNIQLKSYNETLIPLHQYIDRRNAIREDTIPKNIFVFILKRFNVLLLQAIIEEGYEFVDKCLGSIKVEMCKNKKSTIDWGKSDANKKRLLAEGKKLYYKGEAEEAKRLGQSYEAYEWIEHMNEYSLFINWSYSHDNAKRTPNIGEYIFNPCRGLNSAVSKLKKFYSKYTYEELLEKFVYNLNPTTNAN